MSKLEKPFDRHQFFRLKMRTRRRLDGGLLRIVNWLFDKTCDYGWGVGRAGLCWFGHWMIFALILFLKRDARVKSRWSLQDCTGVGRRQLRERSCVPLPRSERRIS